MIQSQSPVNILTDLIC